MQQVSAKYYHLPDYTVWQSIKPKSKNFLPCKLQETLHEASRLAKDRKAFQIWLMQPNAWNSEAEKKEEEEKEEEQEEQKEK